MTASPPSIGLQTLIPQTMEQANSGTTLQAWISHASGQLVKRQHIHAELAFLGHHSDEAAKRTGTGLSNCIVPFHS